VALTPTDVLALAAAESITLDARGDLVIYTPPRRASPELRSAVRENKAAVLALLADGGRSPPNGNGHHSYEGEREKEEDAPTPEKKTRRTTSDTFRAPNLLRRKLLHVDSGLGDAELRVYLFLVGQTLGFGKESDSVSHGQIRDGIRQRNGEVWCTGTGLATRTIINALRSLVERKLITCSKHNDPQFGTVANTYALILEDLPEGPP
jgi:hypothetical protein